MRKNKQFVDIIMPNYNKGEYIEEAIQSVIKQSYQHWNLYIIDDFSNDFSKEVLKKFKKNKKIKVVFLKKNRGPSFCRNIGISLSKSSFISFLDSDDYWPKNKLASQLDYMIKKNINFTYTDYISFFKGNKKKFLQSTNIQDELNFKTFVRNSSINTSTMIFNKKIIKNIKFKNIRKHEDYIYKCEIFRKNKNLFAKKFKNTYAFYRILKNSRSRDRLKSVYYMWVYNKKFNKLSLFDNLLSIFFISINSIKKYGFKLGV
ncbi:MAG: glycosyltransferase family 2 protein [Candidatus Pelagibacter sp.]